MARNSKKKHGVKLVVERTAILIFWIAVWHVLSLVLAQEILLPSPKKTLETFLTLASGAEFWLSVLWSILRIMLGFLYAAAAGLALAVLIYLYGFVGKMISPILHLIRTVPVAAFIILALVWIKTDNLPIFIAFSTVLPIITDGTLGGMYSTDPLILEAASVDGANRHQTLFAMVLPNALPAYLRSAITGIGFAWKSGIAAEIICNPSDSIGGMLKSAKANIESPEVFALTGTVVILSLIISFALKKALKKFLARNDG